MRYVNQLTFSILNPGHFGLESELMIWMSLNEILLYFVVHMFLSTAPCNITYTANVHISPHFEILILHNQTVFIFPIIFLQNFC